MFLRIPIGALRQLLCNFKSSCRLQRYRSRSHLGVCGFQLKAAYSTRDDFKPIPKNHIRLKPPLPVEAPFPNRDTTSIGIPTSTPASGPTSKVWTIPNILTFTRIGATPFIGYFIGVGHVKYALILFVYSCLTDFVDGFIARRFNMQSEMGSILDPFADKFLMATCTVALAYSHTMPLWIAGLIFGRDLMLSLISFHQRYKCLSPPVTTKKFIDIAGTPTHTVHPSLLGKINTALQMVYIAGLVMNPALEAFWEVHFLSEAFQWLGVIVSVTTVLSGFGYLSGKNFKRISKV